MNRASVTVWFDWQIRSLKNGHVRGALAKAMGVMDAELETETSERP